MPLCIGKEKFAVVQLIKSKSKDFLTSNVTFSGNPIVIGNWAYKDQYYSSMKGSFAIDQVPTSIDTAELLVKFVVTTYNSGNPIVFRWSLPSSSIVNVAINRATDHNRPFIWTNSNKYTETTETLSKISKNVVAWIKVKYVKDIGTTICTNNLSNLGATFVSDDYVPSEWFESSPIDLDGIDGSFIPLDKTFNIGGVADNSEAFAGGFHLPLIELKVNNQTIFKGME